MQSRTSVHCTWCSYEQGHYLNWVKLYTNVLNEEYVVTNKRTLLAGCSHVQVYYSLDSSVQVYCGSCALMNYLHCNTVHYSTGNCTVASVLTIYIDHSVRYSTVYVISISKFNVTVTSVLSLLDNSVRY